MTSHKNPRQSGLRPAPNWVNPGRFWLTWPVPSGDPSVDEQAREDCLGLAERLADHAPVSLICASQDVAEIALLTTPGVAAFAAETETGPLRHHAPLWLVDDEGRLAGAVTRSPLGRQMADLAGVPVWQAPPGLPQVLETDGEGTALVALRAADAPAATVLLQDWLGLECLIQLDEGRAHGVTPGARFLSPGLVALPPHPGNHQMLDASPDARGRKLTLVEMPSAKTGGCYADCIVTTPMVVVPDFEDGQGNEAFSRITASLPGQKIEAAPATWLAGEGAGLGALVVVQPAV